MPGVEWLLPVMLDHVDRGRLCLERMVDLLRHAPARVYGIPRKGRIARGMIADLVIVDRRATVRIEDSAVRSKCGWTPYDGMVVRGRVHAAVLRGVLVMQEGETTGPPRGGPVELRSVQLLDPQARHPRNS